jgi:hypothetical protein
VASVTLSVNLPHSYRGTHMSRFIEVLDKFRDEVSYHTLETILMEIRKALHAEESHIEISFPYFLRKKAPVSGLESIMSYDCTISATLAEHLEIAARVDIPAYALPRSREISKVSAHNQRGTVAITVGMTRFIWIEDHRDRRSLRLQPRVRPPEAEDEKHITEAPTRIRASWKTSREVALRLKAGRAAFLQRRGGELRVDSQPQRVRRHFEEGGRVNDPAAAMPRIRRARGYRLYGLDGRRYLDLYQDGGRAILGHRGGRAVTAMKNALSEGLHSCLPSVHEARLLKALGRAFPAYRSFRLFASESRFRRRLARPGRAGDRLGPLIPRSAPSPSTLLGRRAEAFLPREQAAWIDGAEALLPVRPRRRRSARGCLLQSGAAARSLASDPLPGFLLAGVLAGMFSSASMRAAAAAADARG